MNEEEKIAVEFVKKRTKELKKYAKRENELVYDDIILNLINKLQKENEELKEKENKIYKEVQESLSFEKFLIAKDRKPDLFNQGRFYIAQIVYDILNDVQNPEGIHKENKYIKYVNFIPVQKVKDKIEKLEAQYKIALEENSTKAFILKCQITILQELLESEK